MMIASQVLVSGLTNALLTELVQIATDACQNLVESPESGKAKKGGSTLY